MIFELFGVLIDKIGVKFVVVIYFCFFCWGVVVLSVVFVFFGLIRLKWFGFVF